MHRNNDNHAMEQIHHLEKEAFQLANYYFVFQGVIFTAFYHVPHFKCKYVWLPLTLSVLAGVLNVCALARIGWRYMRKLNELDINANRGNGDYVPITVRCTSHWRFVYFLACMLIVAAFLGVTLAGCKVITCYDHHTSPKTEVLKLRT